MFEGLESLVDVGGGTGTVAKAIADVFPDIECAVFDIPYVVAELQGSENLKYLGGDMFEEVPPADAVLLKVNYLFVLFLPLTSIVVYNCHTESCHMVYIWGKFFPTFGD